MSLRSRLMGFFRKVYGKPAIDKAAWDREATLNSADALSCPKCARRYEAWLAGPVSPEARMAEEDAAWKQRRDQQSRARREALRRKPS